MNATPTPAPPPSPPSAPAAEPADRVPAGPPGPARAPRPAERPAPAGESVPAEGRVAALLERARASLDRLTPHQAAEAVRAGALLVDIRYAALRERDGTIPGALVVERNELEWRLDPTCPHRAPGAGDPDRLVVVVCAEGYASGFAARALQDLGLPRATDLIGGFRAWREAGLPVDPDEPGHAVPAGTARPAPGCPAAPASPA